MNVCETPRLLLRRMLETDAAYILELLNEPAFIRYIGDRGVRTLDDACRYIRSNVMESYERYGFGLYMAELKENGTPVGICGLLKRDYLQDPDVGFALSERFRGQGLAAEAAAAVLHYARQHLGLRRISAITVVDNQPSIKLLEGLGMTLCGVIDMPSDTGEKSLNLYLSDPDQGAPRAPRRPGN